MPSASTDQNLPLVRRLEAVGFRAWPATSVQYDGSWQIRLSGGHPSKRLNCVVALDPSDSRDIAVRLEKAARKFEAHGRPILVRETPLTPKPLIDRMRADGWERFEEVMTLTCDLTAIELPEDTLDHLPSHDVGRYVDADLIVHGSDPALKPALAEVVSAIKPPSGLFVIEDPAEGPVAVALCVQDNDLASIMSLAVKADHRQRGLGLEILTAALRWARMRGARTAWLQVVADNAPALALYAKLGFVEAYRYAYWRKGANA
ncbi:MULTISPECIES: GNAT family N-acetyltransferase [Alphaproteobacteria]|uniref:N-acetyltransferase n=2 Tax=Alphaproteobacteria TaxID=28211 RepID=A0A512HLL8_9HYPH|nr:MULTISPECIES: GNAT family N-acetyltransferase [Alphaproteobacteria]GEO86347.1 N-acetyltransferase [Ciceribacter naphthalenivorans]GLR21829.1 N-acetyltransferase [Ciceribacter naphthalenivorans]GLT04685.1 N-acetyltransferase [Sphingomonas psychrolutea]